MPSYLEGKTRLQDIKETRISSHKQNLRQLSLGGPYVRPVDKKSTPNTQQDVAINFFFTL
nr:MAG TPA: hypothetical protein [Caudoviricetes sp.]